LPPGAICGTNSTRGNDGSYTSGRTIPNIKDAGSADPEQAKILRTARQLDLISDQSAQLDSPLKVQKDDSTTLDKGSPRGSRSTRACPSKW